MLVHYIIDPSTSAWASYVCFVKCDYGFPRFLRRLQIAERNHFQSLVSFAEKQLLS